MLFVWFILSLAFLVFSSWLLITLLMLEIITFFILFYISYTLYLVVLSDMFIICFFSVFVMEGVIALAGLIILVSFSGTDYISSSSVLNF